MYQIPQKLNTLNCCQPQVLIGEVMKKIKCFKEYMEQFFHLKSSLKNHLHNLEEAKKRDHRKLGKGVEIIFI